MSAIKELRTILQFEPGNEGNDEIWRESGEAAMKLGRDFQRAMHATNMVIRGSRTPAEMMNMSYGFGKTFVELANHFGIIL